MELVQVEEQVSQNLEEQISAAVCRNGRNKYQSFVYSSILVSMKNMVKNNKCTLQINAPK